MRARKFTKVVLGMLSLAGCLYQVSDITGYYLVYKTVSIVSIAILNVTTAPDLSVCLGFASILDAARIYNDTKARKANTSNPYSNAFSIRNLFKYSPDENDILKACLIRIPESQSIETSRKKECRQFFTIKKFYTQTFICYEFYLAAFENSTYFVSKTGYFLKEPGMLYLLDISTIPRIDQFKVIASETEKLARLRI